MIGSYKIPDYLSPNYGSDEANLRWIADDAEADMANVEESLDEIKDLVSRLRRNCANAMMAVEKMRAENWKDEQLQHMKKVMEEARQNMHYGFPITQKENDDICAWTKQHDVDVHNNPHQYHGVSGGGYEYVFYPTGLGTAGECICTSCKNSAIKVFGENWHRKCKEAGGIFLFQQLG